MNKQWMMAILLGISVTLTGCTDENKTNYEQALAYLEEENYEEAIPLLEELGEYEDAEKQLTIAKEKKEHLDAVAADTEPPLMEGLQTGDIINLEANQETNLKDLLMEKLTISDNVTKDEDITMNLTSSNDLLNPNTNIISGDTPGSLVVTVKASDEADNSSEIKLNIKIGAVHITADNKTPVFYDGELGKISVSEIGYGVVPGYEVYSNANDFIGYWIKMEVDNQSDLPLYAGLHHNYANDYNIVANSESASTQALKKSTRYVYFYQTNVDEAPGEVKQIETNLFLTQSDCDGDVVAEIPLILDLDAF